jgi:galactoside O-acetyltransferase
MQILRFLALAKNELRAYFNAMIFAWPGASGARLRSFRLRAMMASLGATPAFSAGIRVTGAEGVRIGSFFSCGNGCSFYADSGGEIYIGERVALNDDVCLNAAISGQIHIGNNVIIGPRVLMRTTNHVFFCLDVPIRQQGHIPKAIKIEDDVWIGGNVTILGGTKIGKGAVVGAGAVVTRDVPPYAIVGGVPARHLKWRENRPTPVPTHRPKN